MVLRNRTQLSAADRHPLFSFFPAALHSGLAFHPPMMQLVMQVVQLARCSLMPSCRMKATASER